MTVDKLARGHPASHVVPAVLALAEEHDRRALAAGATARELGTTLRRTGAGGGRP